MGNYFEDRNSTRELRELDSQIQQLKQQLEVENKNNYEMSAEMEHLKNQLKEAVEVIEFYGNKENWDTRDKLFDYLTLAKIINEDDLDDRDNFFVKIHGGKRARQFLAKYRGRNEF